MSGHLSMRPTWTSPSRVDGPAWPCTGRGLPGRRVTATPVRSYRTISPLPVRDSRVAAPSAVYFCGTFPRVSPGGRYPPPCPLVSGLSSRGFLSPRGPLGPLFDGSHRAAIRPSGRRDMVARMRTAVVTGAGGGLGRAIALELARRRLRRLGHRRRRRGRRTHRSAIAELTRSPATRRRRQASPRRARRGRLPSPGSGSRGRGRLARPLGQQRRRSLHRPLPGSRTRRPAARCSRSTPSAR